MTPSPADWDDLSAIFRLSIDMLAVVQRGGIVLRAGTAWRSVLGFEPEQVEGKNVFNLVHPEDRRLAISEARKVEERNAAARIQARMRTKSGEYRWLDWSISPAPGGDVMYCIARDVQELHRRQEEEEMLIDALQQTTRTLHETAHELDGIRAEAEYLATYDMLTGLLNRPAWMAAVANTAPGAIALLDIDHFKQVNDTYGHPIGDVVLTSIAQRMSHAIESETCSIGRIGGEEFAIAFAESAFMARSLTRQVVDAVGGTPVATAAGALSVTMSAGVSDWPEIGEDRFARAYEAADRALYRAKCNGRNRVVLAPVERAA